MSRHARLFGTGSPNSLIAAWTGGIGGDVGAAAVNALSVGADPRFGNDFSEGAASVLAGFAILVVGLD